MESLAKALRARNLRK